MHSAGFYRRALREAGFAEIDVAPVQADDATPFDRLQPVIGLPWLVIPRFAYPVTPTLVTAVR